MTVSTEIRAGGASSASLAQEDVLASVRAASGLANVYEDGLNPRLGRLLRHLDQDVGLDLDGKRAAHATVRDLLVDRARMLADREKYPEIAGEVIEQPLFVVGSGRSGTTLMQMLLGADPQNRMAMWWETRHPSPPPGISPPDDARIARSDREILDMLEVDPNLLISHPYYDQGSISAAECEAIAALDLRIVRRTLFYNIPGIIDVDLDDDRAGFYQFHKKVLQALQWRRPKKRWALKGVTHHANLPALKAVYPDAMIVWLHRDPQRVFPSLMELIATLVERTAKTKIDRRAWGRKILDNHLQQLKASADSPLADHPDVHHLLYADMARNHLGAVEGIYKYFNIPFPETSRRAIESWLKDPANRGDRHGRFAYALEDFGISADELEAATAFYRERFNVPSER